MAASNEARQKQILISLFSVVGLVLWLQFFLIPQWTSAGRLGTEQKKMRTQLDKAKRELAHLPELQKKIEMLSAQYTPPAGGGGPPEEQLPNLLDAIAQSARSAQVRVVSLRPKQEIVGSQIGPSGYIEIPLELVGTAGYHQIGRFLSDLEGSSHLLRVRQLDIRSGEKDIWSHQVNVLLMAFLTPQEGKQ